MKISRKVLTAVALTLISSSPAWAVYKCKNKFDRIIYQEQPCEMTATQGQKIDATPSASGVSDDSSFNTISIGMTDKQVIQTWGKPHKINRTVSKYGSREQWIYYRSKHRDQYVYLEDDVVTSISSN